MSFLCCLTFSDCNTTVFHPCELVAVSCIASRWCEWKCCAKILSRRFESITHQKKKRIQRVMSASYPKLKLSLTANYVLCFFFLKKVRLERLLQNSCLDPRMLMTGARRTGVSLHLLIPTFQTDQQKLSWPTNFILIQKVYRPAGLKRTLFFSKIAPPPTTNPPRHWNIWMHTYSIVGSVHVALSF